MADDSSIQFISGDLASGDSKSLGLDCKQFQISRIQSSNHPLFGLAYERLWEEFGPQHEMELQKIIEQRLSWHPAAQFEDTWMRYEIFLVRLNGEFVAVRDHTAIVNTGGGAPFAVSHLSHILVAPSWRRTGLAGWLRAWPIQTARACLTAAGLSLTVPITLVLEMEPPSPAFEKAWIRLKAYEKAGFKKLDPLKVDYFQPDFRPNEAIDAAGGPRPLPFSLLLRRLGRENELSLGGFEVRQIVHCLYCMYSFGCRPNDMAPLWARLRAYPAPEEKIRLVAPSG